MSGNGPFENKLLDYSTAAPYAGIIQVRFKGYFLSPVRHPRILLIKYPNLSI